jgi:hypothetical protein
MLSTHPVVRGLTVFLTVCGVAVALAVAPARADDGAPAAVDPAALVPVEGAATPTAPLVPTTSLDAPTDTPAPPETPVVLPVLPAIPPAIPPAATAGSPPPAVSTEVPPPPAPSPDPAPQAAPPDTNTGTGAAAPAPPSTPVTAGTEDAGDTGNTALDNSNDITVSSPSEPPQTFIWNWFWNCSTDEAVPAVTSPPANATVIVLNWHWDCAEPPPPLDVAGVTVCDSCNVAISVRVASPGDTGDLTQSIAAATAAAASDIADPLESALQSAPAPAPVPPAPTAWTIPASTIPAPTMPAATAPAVTAPLLPAQAVPAPPQVDPEGPEPTQISAPAAFGAARAKVPRRAAGDRQARGRSPAAGRAAALVRVVVIERWIEHHTVARAASGPAVRKARPVAASGRGPVPSAPSLPSLPVPILAGAGLASAQGGGPGAVAALASGLALLFAYMIFTALRLLPVVPPARGADANPHPPG